MTPTLDVLDHGQPISFSFDELMRYHGPGSPAGVAHAFKVMELALPLLDPGGRPDRRRIAIETAFGGPGARDAFELVTRAVSDGRYVVDEALARPGRGLALERFVFRLRCGEREATLVARPGFVPERMIMLARQVGRDAAEERELKALKQDTARHVMATPAHDVYAVE